MATIKFGTDGWRGVISDDFTDENLARVVAGYGAWLMERASGGQPSVAIGYDLRFGSERFARLAATLLRRMGLRVILSDRPCPTPLISYIIQSRNLDGGLIITASHNPYYFNGIKLRVDRGISPPDDVLEEVMSHIRDRQVTLRSSSAPPDFAVDENLVEEYREALRKALDERVFAGLNGTIVVDYMHGVLQGWVEQILGSVRVRALNAHRDATFGNGSPEPAPDKLKDLKNAVIRENALLGVAFDGDGDRIAVVDNTGRILTAQELFPLLLSHLYRRGIRGSVARTYPTTDWVKRVADQAHETIRDVPVGFKHLSPLLVRREVIMAGEESGGIAFAHHIPERDALFVFLLILEMLYEARIPLSEVVSQFTRKYGNLYYRRKDYVLQRGGWLHEAKSRVIALVCEACGMAVDQENDGIKFRIRDGEWVMVRESGTEPVLRVYAESESEETLASRLTTIESLLLEAGAPVPHEPFPK
ncbi:MAG: hypothetical protein V2G42_00175 [bacterium JZ-2024 1]